MLIVLLFIVLILIILKIYLNNEDFNNNYSGCKNLLSSQQKIFNERGIKYSDKEIDFYIPCLGEDCQMVSNRINKINGVIRVNAIDGCNKINSKINLWNMLKKKYKDQVTDIMPDTYVLFNNYHWNGWNEWKNKNKNQIYILKNYKQRQLGLKLTNNLDKIKNYKNQGYYIIQKVLQDPYLINKRKVNLRIYYLIICRYGKVNGYIYNNGFVYYTPKFWEKNSLNDDKVITTGYIDRKVYIDNPLTLQDFLTHLKKDRGENKFLHNLKKLFNQITHALDNNICQNDKSKIWFQIFGADVDVGNQLTPKLIEINKGPDLGSKDERDGFVKLNLQRDIYDLVDEITPSKRENGFIHIYS